MLLVRWQSQGCLLMPVGVTACLLTCLIACLLTRHLRWTITKVADKVQDPVGGLMSKTLLHGAQLPVFNFRNRSRGPSPFFSVSCITRDRTKSNTKLPMSKHRVDGRRMEQLAVICVPSSLRGNVLQMTTAGDEFTTSNFPSGTW